MFYLSIYAVAINPDFLILSHKPSYFNIEHLLNPKRRLLGNALMAKLSFSSETSTKKPQNHIESMPNPKNSFNFCRNPKARSK